MNELTTNTRSGTFTIAGTTTSPATNVTVNTSNAVLYSAYDALNRLTSMIDGVGTTIYIFNAAGQLLSEDGPWASDTVSYGYNSRLCRKKERSIYLDTQAAIADKSLE